MSLGCMLMRSVNRIQYIIIIIIALSSFYPLSPAQGKNKGELLNGYYIDDGWGEELSTTVMVYDGDLSVSVNNHDPQLSNGEVTPESGSSSTPFYYTVDYYDQDGDDPATISVYIDDVSVSMVLDSGQAHQGAYKSSAHTHASGTHMFYFIASDGDGGSTRFPASGSIDGPTVNDAPQLSNGIVVPESGDSSTPFYYSVDYYDHNEDAPETISVYIDSESNSMTLDSGDAYQGTYMSGPHRLTSGTHTYYFITSDGDGGSTRLPDVGIMVGPTVNDTPQLSDGKVEPETGNSATQFSYSVDYYDQDEDDPQTIGVYIDDEPVSMTLESGHAYQGTYTSSPQSLASGSHTYYFTALDGAGEVIRFPVSGYLQGPTVNDVPQLSQGSVTPEEGSSVTDFYYYVEYYDVDGDGPGTKYVYIDDVPYAMSLYTGEAGSGTYRYGPKLLNVGSHEFYFSFDDGYHDLVRLPLVGSYSGPEMTFASLYVYDNVGSAAIFLDDVDTGYTTPSLISPVDVGMHKIALSKDEYVSFPSSAMVEVSQAQTAEVPFILLPCPAVISLENEAFNLQLLREFRDKVLHRTEFGKRYSDLYYTHAAEVSLLMVVDEGVRIKVERVFQQVIPLITLLLEGERVVVLSRLEGAIELLCSELEDKGSPSLRETVKKFRQKVHQREFIKELGVQVE